MARRSVAEGALSEAYDDVDALLDDYPEFADLAQLLESVGQWTKVVGRELQATAPGAMQGALTGFMMGGPVGAVAGAAMGGAGARLGTASSSGAAGGASNTAAVQLLAARLRPEVIQALGAMALGPAGAGAVPVAGTQVPVAAFANMLGALSTQAAAQHGTRAPSARPEALLALLSDAADDDDDDDDDAADGWDEALAERDLADLDRLEAE